MYDSHFDYSRVTEKYGLCVSEHLVRAIRAQARLMLIPYFQKVALTNLDDGKMISYPKLTDLAARIINEVYENGSMGYELEDEAREEALEFVNSLTNYQKECL